MYGLISFVLVVAWCFKGDIPMLFAAGVFAIADAIANMFRAKK